MKKTIMHLLLLCALLCMACATTPPDSAHMRDEEYYARGMTRLEARNYIEAIEDFEDLRDRFPLSQYAVLALLRLGECHYLQKNYIEAQYFFETFRRMHPSHARVDYSIFMAGMCQFNQILSHDRDQSAARAAVSHFELLFEVFPRSPYAGRALSKIAEAKQRIAEHEFFVGGFYLKKKNYAGAYARFDRLLMQYPHAIARDRVLLPMAKACLYDDQVEKGRRILQLLITRYPNGEYAAEARRLLARY